jgi:hypothetical protein
MFSLEKALAEANSVLGQRVQKRTISYVLYFSNNTKQPEGKITGFTIKQLINEFRDLGRSYRFAFVTKINDDKVLRFYDQQKSKKFFALTRTRKAK